MAVTITSVTMTAKLNVKYDKLLNLKEICLKTNNCEYNRKYYDRLLIRLRNPSVTVAVHTSGKLILTGARSEYIGRVGLRRVGRLIQKIGYQITISDMKVVNIAGTYDFKTDYNLNTLSTFLELNASFEPEIFPNLIWKADNKTVIISRKGKTIFTGFKSVEDINHLLYFFAGKLLEFDF